MVTWHEVTTFILILLLSGCSESMDEETGNQPGNENDEYSFTFDAYWQEGVLPNQTIAVMSGELPTVFAKSFVWDNSQDRPAQTMLRITVDTDTTLDSEPCSWIVESDTTMSSTTMSCTITPQDYGDARSAAIVASLEIDDEIIASKTVALSIRHPVPDNMVPEIVSQIPDEPLTAGEEFSFQIEVDDERPESVSFEVEELPYWIEHDGDGLFTGAAPMISSEDMPDNSDTYSFWLGVMAVDDMNDFCRQKSEIEVLPSD